MSRSEKLIAMEAIWADLSQDDSSFESPAWHAEELERTESMVQEGKAKFSDWDEAKARIRDRAGKLG